MISHYFVAVRRELKTLRGKGVVTTGDGLLATFKVPAAAVSCATAIREAVRTLGLEIRVGLHAGEYKVSGAEVVGLAFHIGARVAAKARCRRGPGLERGQGTDVAVGNSLQGSRRSPTERRAGAMAPVPGRTLRCPASVDTGFAWTVCAITGRVIGFDDETSIDAIDRKIVERAFAERISSDAAGHEDLPGAAMRAAATAWLAPLPP